MSAHDPIRHRLGDVRPNAPGVAHDDPTGSRHGALTAPLAATALQRRSDSTGRDGPRRVDTSGPGSAANPLTERDRASEAWGRNGPRIPGAGFESPWRYSRTPLHMRGFG